MNSTLTRKVLLVMLSVIMLASLSASPLMFADEIDNDLKPHESSSDSNVQEDSAVQAENTADSAPQSEGSEPDDSIGILEDGAEDLDVDILEMSPAEEISTLAEQTGPWERVGGSTRYGTMVEIVLKYMYSGLAGNYDTVVVATGEQFPDALSGSSLAGLYGSPMILAEKKTLGPYSYDAMSWMSNKRILILGGPNSISPHVENQIREINSSREVIRIAGEDRIETAELIYEAGIGRWSDTLIIATGSVPADSLSISPYAYKSHAPIFLTDNLGNLRESTMDAIAAGTFSKAIVVGGTSVISSDTENWLSSILGQNSVIRLSGSDRYKTSAQVADWLTGKISNIAFQPSSIFTYNNMAVACGQNNKFADALSASALCGTYSSVLMLADLGSIGTYGIHENIRSNKEAITKGFILGGPAAISPYVEFQLRNFRKTTVYRGEEIISAAVSRLGCPYVWAASGPYQFDCSGFTSWSYAQAGRGYLRHYDRWQYNDAKQRWAFSARGAEPGDVLWWDGHVGIYLGANYYIHALPGYTSWGYTHPGGVEYAYQGNLSTAIVLRF